MSSNATGYEGIHSQNLCHNATRCAPAVVNKCTSIIAPINRANGNSSQLSPCSAIASMPPGTGIFFNHAFSSESKNGAGFDITRLAHLATAASKFEEVQSADRSSPLRLAWTLKPGKAISKKRRTARNNRKFETLHFPNFEISVAEPWSTANEAYNASMPQYQACEPNEEHSTDSLKSSSIIGECVSSKISAETISSFGGQSITSSCLTGGNQGTSLGSPRSSTVHNKARRKPETRVERYARTILKFVGEGSVPEKLIRFTLGNNPDTSKALRLLLTHRKLKRLGEGGKGSAYLYLATPFGLQEIEQMTAQAQEI